MRGAAKVRALENAAQRAFRVAIARGAEYRDGWWWGSRSPFSPATRAALRHVATGTAAFRRNLLGR